MFGCLVAYLVVLLLSAPTWGKPGRAILGKMEGYFLFVMYAVAAAVFIYIVCTTDPEL